MYYFVKSIVELVKLGFIYPSEVNLKQIIIIMVNLK